MQKPRILVVEDDKEIQLVLTSCLIAQGWEVKATADIDVAFKLLNTETFHAVSTDMDLPELNGLHVARAAYKKAKLFMFAANDAGKEMFESLGGKYFYKDRISVYLEVLEKVRRQVENQIEVEAVAA